jgi:hypothetical protein
MRPFAPEDDETEKWRPVSPAQRTLTFASERLSALVRDSCHVLHGLEINRGELPLHGVDQRGESSPDLILLAGARFLDRHGVVDRLNTVAQEVHIRNRIMQR